MDGSLDIEALERDVVAAVAPREVVEIGGFLVPLEDGAIGRAKSAVPLRHDVDARAVDEIVDAYRQRGLKPAFRLAEVPELEAVRAALRRHGLTGQQPTVMKVGAVADLAAVSEAPARVLAQLDEAWSSVFLGEGFDPEEGASRIAALRRSPGAAYGAAGEGGATHAVGVGSFGSAWGGIHGMRTAPAHRGRGYAAAILGALGREMAARGLDRVVLQVEEANPARRIYRRAGLKPIWAYRYWR